ncbi:hypothetical protein L1987_86599 [Smallanthus sonchifolius]|uniref:Uncharacterized protein n=1 Tax=Smallanthus sonchifolius TaxID=185202 RepID=A0ACB8XZ80_9ASTR|nr:hypothetical protein L1987_86599 [Smallanthus sonchifolius]
MMWHACRALTRVACGIRTSMMWRSRYGVSIVWRVRTSVACGIWTMVARRSPCGVNAVWPKSVGVAEDSSRWVQTRGSGRGAPFHSPFTSPQPHPPSAPSRSGVLITILTGFR